MRCTALDSMESHSRSSNRNRPRPHRSGIAALVRPRSNWEPTCSRRRPHRTAAAGNARAGLAPIGNHHRPHRKPDDTSRDDYV